MTTRARHHRRPAAGGGRLTGLLALCHVIAVTGVLVALASPAHAAPCGRLDAIEASLAESYGEVPTMLGNTERTITIAFVNPETGTFTIVIAGSDGVGCLVAAGEHWREVKKGRPS